MSKVFVTGDTHGVYDFNKLIDFKENFKEHITKEDYVIIAGDFGVVWTDEPDEEEKFTLAWLDECPWTTLFIDGNHENHPRLNAFPEVKILGGRAHKISKKVYHIMRGEVINIDGLKILCMGGADSHDKHYRVDRRDWWAEERITEADVENARQNLARYNFNVDYVISHSLPRSIQFKLFPYMKPSRSCFLLEEVYSMLYIEEAWITGHYHEDMIKKEEGNYFRMIYQNIIMLQLEGDKYDKLQ